MMTKSPMISCFMLVMFLSMGVFLPTTWAVGAMKADINTASMAQLESVTGMGHDTAQNILDYKKEHGKFKSMNELEAVSEVGTVRLKALNGVFMVEPKEKAHKKTSMK